MSDDKVVAVVEVEFTVISEYSAEIEVEVSREIAEDPDKLHKYIEDHEEWSETGGADCQDESYDLDNVSLSEIIEEETD